MVKLAAAFVRYKMYFKGALLLVLTVMLGWFVHMSIPSIQEHHQGQIPQDPQNPITKETRTTTNNAPQEPLPQHAHPSKISVRPASMQQRFPDTEPRIHVTEGRLSIVVHKRLLTWVIDQIALTSGVAIIIADNVPNATISLNIQDIPFDQALKMILQDFDVLYLYERLGDAPTALTTVWIYPQGTTQHFLPSSLDMLAMNQETQASVARLPLDKRIETSEEVRERGREAEAETVLQALEDRDDQMRYHTLYQSLQKGVVLPVKVLGDLIYADPSPDIRLMALGMIINHATIDRGTVLDIVTWATRDSSESVENLAKQSLERLENPD